MRFRALNRPQVAWSDCQLRRRFRSRKRPGWRKSNRSEARTRLWNSRRSDGASAKRAPAPGEGHFAGRSMCALRVRAVARGDARAQSPGTTQTREARRPLAASDVPDAIAPLSMRSLREEVAGSKPGCRAESPDPAEAPRAASRAGRLGVAFDPH